MEMKPRPRSRWTCRRIHCMSFQHFIIIMIWIDSEWFSNFSYILPYSVANSAQILIGISVLFTFGLKFYAPMDIMWRRIKPNIPKDRHNISQIAFRAGCILVMGSIAAVVPKLDPFISLIGAVLTSFLSKLNIFFRNKALNIDSLIHHYSLQVFLFLL